jgi:peptidoglycan/LPS O-acetylase OafA/YrhL
MNQPPPTNPLSTQPAPTIVTLQALRGIAAMLVVFAHAIDCQQVFVPGHSTLTRFYSLENFGAVGVDLFFVISGFIMATITPSSGEDRAALRFAVKRIIRIVPIYWLLSLVTALLAPPNGSISASRIIATITFIPLYPHGKYLAPIILAGWSLSFEMYFYLLITGALAVRIRDRVITPIAWLCAVLALIGVITKPIGSFASFALNPLLAEFALGCLIGNLYRRRKSDLPIFLTSTLLACGLGCLLATLLLGFGSISEIYNTLMGDASAKRLLLWGIPASLVVAGIVFNENRWRNFVPRPLRLIGDASYSIYLLQMLAIKQFAMRWSLAGFTHPDLFILAAVSFATLAGIAHYGILEKPLTAWLARRAAKLLDRRSTHSEPIFVAPACTLVPATT